MISTDEEYTAACEEAHELIEWWERLTCQTDPADPVTLSNIHSRLQKLHSKMADFQRRRVPNVDHMSTSQHGNQRS